MEEHKTIKAWHKKIRRGKHQVHLIVSNEKELIFKYTTTVLAERQLSKFKKKYKLIEFIGYYGSYTE